MSETENKFTKVEIGEVAQAVNPSEYKYALFSLDGDLRCR
jgi:hypothetical protein